MLRWLVATILIAALPGLARGPQSRGVPLAKRPNQVATVTDLELAPATQRCTNWAWAAALEAALRHRQVPLAQSFWVEKMNGGQICLDRPLIVREAGRHALSNDVQPQDLQALADGITGEYTLDDSRKVRIAAHSSAGLPQEPNALIADLRDSRPVLLFWRNHAYLLYSILYDEYIYPTGQRMYFMKELRLLDPLQPAGKQKVSFTVGEDDAAEIEGVVEITATPVEGTQWIR